MERFMLALIILLCHNCFAHAQERQGKLIDKPARFSDRFGLRKPASVNSEASVWQNQDGGRKRFGSDQGEGTRFLHANQKDTAILLTGDIIPNQDRQNLSSCQYHKPGRKRFITTGAAFVDDMIHLIDAICVKKDFNRVRVSENIGLKFSANPRKGQASFVLKVKY